MHLQKRMSPARDGAQSAIQVRQITMAEIRERDTRRQACAVLLTALASENPAHVYAARILTRRLGISPQRARLVAELAGLAVPT